MTPKEQRKYHLSIQHHSHFEYHNFFAVVRSKVLKNGVSVHPAKVKTLKVATLIYMHTFPHQSH